MNSATSGSLQSSSGGGGGGEYEEFTSRPDSLSSFLNLPPHPTPTSTSSPFFDSLSSFLHNPFPQSPPSDPTLHPLPSSSSPWPSRPPPPTSTPIPTSSSGPNPQPSSAVPAAGGPTRGSKKRSRASRRAPTTVLTTDTSNFRAMVQEFTGFPSPPFSTSHLPRPRLLDPSSPPYLLRPFAHKFNSPTFSPTLSSSPPSLSILDAINSAARTSITTNTNSSSALASTSASPSYTTTASNLLNIQNPILQFQSTPTFSALRPPPPLDFGDLGSLVASDRGGPVSRTVDGLSGWTDKSGQPEKGPESLAPAVGRGDGVVDSWIVSSD